MEFTVERNRIYMQDEQGKLLAEILFPDEGKGSAVVITSTFVDRSLRGQGVADQLMQAVIKELQSQNKMAKAVCSYAVEWFELHPEHNGLYIKDRF